jgi:hypothetical protein
MDIKELTILPDADSKALEELKKNTCIVPRLDKTTALKLEFAISANLFTRGKRKLNMNEVLFLDR